MKNPNPGQPEADGPRRSTPAFILWLVAVAVLTWFARVKREPWALVGILALVALAPWFRRRWREPEWLETIAPSASLQARIWSGFGWIAAAFGVLFMVIGLVQIPFALAKGDNVRALTSCIVFGMGIGFFVVGRWLIRNRRPFSSGGE